jgi:hypothetical protein
MAMVKVYSFPPDSPAGLVSTLDLKCLVLPAICDPSLTGQITAKAATPLMMMIPSRDWKPPILIATETVKEVILPLPMLEIHRQARTAVAAPSTAPVPMTVALAPMRILRMASLQRRPGTDPNKVRSKPYILFYFP